MKKVKVKVMGSQRTIPQLAKSWNVDPAVIRDMHHSLRCKGVQLVGGKFGMALTSDKDLAEMQIKKMLGQCEEIQEAAEGMLKGMNGWRGDLTEEEELYLSHLPEAVLESPEDPMMMFNQIEVRNGQIVEI